MADAQNSDSSSITIRQDWNPGVEAMLAGWCDEAKCFEWMHTETYSFFDQRARALTITSNVLTALSGISNIMAGGSTINGFQLSWIFGTIAIIISITNPNRFNYNDNCQLQLKIGLIIIIIASLTFQKK
jgi:hypothetical protein